MSKLTKPIAKALAVDTPKLFNDSPTLYLLVKPSGSKSWVQRIHIGGKPVSLGLGSFELVTIQEARDTAIDNRRLVRRGGDPRDAKQAARIPTIAEALEAVIDIQRPTWKDVERIERRWRRAFDSHAERLMPMPVNEVEAGDILAALAPIWTAKAETARRLRQHFNAVMHWAVAQGHRGFNPMDAVSAALPKNAAKGNAKHHKALPFAEVGAALNTIEGSGAWWATKAAFRFLVLTAARSGEVRNMSWDEIEGDCWIVPGERMKAGREHRVPLSREALAVLAEARGHGDGSGLVFPSQRGKAMTDSTMSKLVRENGIGAVPHGFRSSFRDWAAEKTSVPREIAELALAHVEGSAAERAYRRTDYFEQRRDLMQQWADFVTRKPGKVVQLRRDAR